MISAHILHSVSYSGSWGQAALSAEQFIDKAADLGYDGVLLSSKRPHVSPLDYDAKARAALRAKLESRKLSTVVVAGYNNITADLDHTEVPQRELQIVYITELARLTHDLGGKILRIFTGYEHPASAYGAQWNMVVATLKECAKRASDFGVTIGVQNHHDIAVGYEAMHDLILAINEPNCRALFDAWAPALHTVDFYSAARRMGPLTVHTTVADYQLRPRYKYHPALVNYTAEVPHVQAVPMGDGFIDYQQFFTILEDTGFSGSVAYEMCSPLLGGGDMETLDRYARKFLDYMTLYRESRQMLASTTT
ncbi:MAG: sugar phosphate isomerase/epimerase [Bryobacterales bacterium]|nr:sugar phosphate isomerase/epimerase [Bryobacterales bacterium]